MQRASKVYWRLPDWMKSPNPLVKDNLMMLEFQNGGTTQAFPLKREGPRSFGFTKAKFDEMAFQEAARSVWGGLIPTLGSKGSVMAVSTPNGKGNLFAELWFDRDGRHAGIKRKTLHWRQHPEHDEEWYKKTTASMDSQQIAREFELSFAHYAGKPVWPDFNHHTHVLEHNAEVSADRALYHGWDFGFHYPAWTLWQRNHSDQWVGIDELQGYDEPFDEFAERVLERCEAMYDRRVVHEIHCCPSDGGKRYQTRAMSGARSNVDQIKQTFSIGTRKPQIKYMAPRVGSRFHEQACLLETRQTFPVRQDGRTGMIVSPRMKMFIEGAAGGYCYPEKRDDEQPEKNEYSHTQDTYQSVVSVYNRLTKKGRVGHSTVAKVGPTRRPRDRDRFRTGLTRRR